MIDQVIGLGTGLVSLLKINDVLQSGSNISDIDTKLRELKDSGNKYALLKSKGSIVRLTKTLQITPTVIISRTLQREEVISKIISANVDLFTAFFMQAFNMITSLYGESPSYALSILSTESATEVMGADAIKNIFSGGNLGITFEDDETSLMDTLLDDTIIGRPTKRPINGDVNGNRAVTTKGPDFKDTVLNSIYMREIMIKMELPYGMMSNKDEFEEAKKSNKKVEPIFKEMGKKTIELPILIRANIKYIEPSSFYDAISTNNTRRKLGFRFNEWRSGLLSLKDLLLADDLISEYGKAAFRDRDELLSFINSKNIAANSKLIMDRTIGFQKYYNMLIIDKTEAIYASREMMGDITTDKNKDNFLNAIGGLMFSVVDTSWETVDIYIRDLKGVSSVSFKNLKKNGKNDSVVSELTDVFKSMMMNRAPSF